MELKPGTKLRSTTCSTEVIIIKAPAGSVEVMCGGAPMQPADGGAATQQNPPPGAGGAGTQLGKRYVDDALGLELLCTKAGSGALSVGERDLALKDAKPLPASD